MLVNLDPKSKAGPLEWVQVVVGAVHVVVPPRWPPRPFLKPKAGSQKRCLRLLRIAGHEIEVTEAARRVGVPSRQFRPLQQQKRPVVGLPNPPEQGRCDKTRRPPGALLPQQALGHLNAGPAQSSSRERAQAVLRGELWRQSFEEAVYVLPELVSRHR